MSMEAARSAALSPFEQLRHAREIVQSEAQTLLAVAGRLDREFCRAVGALMAFPDDSEPDAQAPAPEPIKVF